MMNQTNDYCDNSVTNVTILTNIIVVTNVTVVTNRTVVTNVTSVTIEMLASQWK